jgi:hypothetical protein
VNLRVNIAMASRWLRIGIAVFVATSAAIRASYVEAAWPAWLGLFNFTQAASQKTEKKTKETYAERHRPKTGATPHSKPSRQATAEKEKQVAK